MAENEGGEVGPRGNDWEVVTLTSSAYAASPGGSAPPVSKLATGSENSESVDDQASESSNLVENKGQTPENSSSVENKDEAPDMMVRSKHFVVPPIPPEDEIHSLHKGPQFPSKESVRSETKKPDDICIERLAMSNPYPEKFDEKASILGIDGTEFDRGEALQGLMNQQDSLYSSEALSSSIHSEPSMIHTDPNVAESIFEEGYVSTDEEHILNSPKYSDKEADECNLPCTAWWKRSALTIYSHVKDTNALWSIFIATAVMGLVIIGQRLQLKWQSTTDERLYRRLGQLSRFKDVIVGGQRRGSLVSNGNTNL